MAYRVGVDIGGTFIDFCVFDTETRDLHTLKVLTTPAEPGAEVMEGMRQLEETTGSRPPLSKASSTAPPSASIL